MTNTSGQYKIKTPHAAVIVWNYVDRIVAPSHSAAPEDSATLESVLDTTEPAIISTLSCISISTSKTKGQAEGTFTVVLAPTKNWVGTLTAGSWLAIMMSNEPITQQDIQKANKKHVKMIGKIESVRVETTVADDGARNTRYYVSGVDWAHIFNNTLYIDNLIASKLDPVSQGNGAAVALRNLLFGDGGTPKSFRVDDNLTALIGIFGKQELGSFTRDGKTINRIAATLYSFRMPQAMKDFFNFVDANGKPAAGLEINKILNLVSGKLIADDQYKPTNEAVGFINPFSLQGQHTFWQLLIENSNPVLNEMFAEMDWVGDNDSDMSLALTLYNRIKPFSYKDFDPDGGQSIGPMSYFQYVKRHDLDAMEVISVNAGTNWRDKFNFVEIKPTQEGYEVLENLYKQKTQAADTVAFEREGFRPLILDVKQLPAADNDSSGLGYDTSKLSEWVVLLRDWYFDTHRMLNGTIVIHGQTDYIAVGDNIRFDAGLINPTTNLTVDQYSEQQSMYILGHVENVSNSFTVSADGARSYTTTIQYVRGILVDGNSIIFGRGTLDARANSIPNSGRRNTVNVVAPSEDDNSNNGNGQ